MDYRFAEEDFTFAIGSAQYDNAEDVISWVRGVKHSMPPGALEEAVVELDGYASDTGDPNGNYVLSRDRSNHIWEIVSEQLEYGRLSLEQAIDFINNDELVEVTPQNIRMRKKLLSHTQRLRDIASKKRSL